MAGELEKKVEKEKSEGTHRIKFDKTAYDRTYDPYNFEHFNHVLPTYLLYGMRSMVKSFADAGLPTTSPSLLATFYGYLKANGYASRVCLEEDRVLTESESIVGTSSSSAQKRKYERYVNPDTGEKGLYLSARWVNNFCSHAKLTMRRASSPAEKKHSPEELAKTKEDFVLRVAYLVHEFNIPIDLVGNLDESAAKLPHYPEYDEEGRPIRYVRSRQHRTTISQPFQPCTPTPSRRHPCLASYTARPWQRRRWRRGRRRWRRRERWWQRRRWRRG